MYRLFVQACWSLGLIWPDNALVTHRCSFLIVYLPWARFLPMGSLDRNVRQGWFTLPEFEWSSYAPQVRHSSRTSWRRAVDNHVVREPAAYIPASAAVTITHPYYPYSSTHPRKTPGIGSIALSDRWGKKKVYGQDISPCTVYWIIYLISGQHHVQKCAEWLSVRKPQLRFFLPDQLWHGVQVLLKLCALCSGKRFISVYDNLDSLCVSQSTHRSACHARCPPWPVIGKNS